MKTGVRYKIQGARAPRSFAGWFFLSFVLSSTSLSAANPMQRLFMCVNYIVVVRYATVILLSGAHETRLKYLSFAFARSLYVYIYDNTVT